jgi:type II secretory pathway component PulF
MAEDLLYRYVAVDGQGRRRKGAISAGSQAAAFQQLRRDGLSPVDLRAGKAGAVSPHASSLGDRGVAEFLADLATLLRAGADMTGALSVLAAHAERAAERALSRSLSVKISTGVAVSEAFEAGLRRRLRFVAAIVAAGEAAGDLAGGMERAAEMLQSRIKLREQFVSAISYPAFVLVSTVVALFAILMFVVPALAPLVSEAGAEPPLSIKLMLATSAFLSDNGEMLGGGLVVIAILGVAAWWSGLMRPIVERALLDGPAREIVSNLTYGGFSIALGGMLAAGAPISEALRLAGQTVSSKVAQQRLEAAALEVRQGTALSDAATRVRNFPPTITRLIAVGERSGSLGAMVERGGRAVEEKALRRVSAAGRVLGPALIVCLGALIGLLMAGLLSGVSQLGSAELK